MNVQIRNDGKLGRLERLVKIAVIGCNMCDRVFCFVVVFWRFWFTSFLHLNFCVLNFLMKTV